MAKNSTTSDLNQIAILNSSIEKMEAKIETLKNRNFLLFGENLMLKDNNEFPKLCQEQNRRDLFRNVRIDFENAKDKLINRTDSCFPFKSDSVKYQVRRLFGDKAFCSSDSCPCFKFCSVIASKDPIRTSLKRKGFVSTDSTRKNTVHFSRTVHKGRIELTSPVYGTLSFSGSDWREASKKIRDHFKASPIEGLTDSAIAGFTHKGADNKLAAAFG